MMVDYACFTLREFQILPYFPYRVHRLSLDYLYDACVLPRHSPPEASPPPVRQRWCPGPPEAQRSPVPHCIRLFRPQLFTRLLCACDRATTREKRRMGQGLCPRGGPHPAGKNQCVNKPVPRVAISVARKTHGTENGLILRKDGGRRLEQALESGAGRRPRRRQGAAARPADTAHRPGSGQSWTAQREPQAIPEVAQPPAPVSSILPAAAPRQARLRNTLAGSLPSSCSKPADKRLTTHGANLHRTYSTSPRFVESPPQSSKD